MDAVLNWLWQGTAVALALFVMLRVLERAPANIRYIVSGLALLIVLAIPVLPWLAPMADQPQAAPYAAVAPVVALPAAAWTSTEAMLALWSLWAGLHFFLLFRALIGVQRARRGSRPFPADVERRLHHWMHVSGADRRARLVLSDAVGSAAVLGCGTPMIAVAPALVEHLSDDELDHVVIHEWAHVQRRDDLANLLQLASRAVAGWHPAVWAINRRLQVEREVACDEMAVAVSGSPRSYATCLVKLADLAAATRMPVVASGVLTAGSLRHRVTRIVSAGVMAPTLRARGLATATVVVLTALSTTLGAFEVFVASAPETRGRTVAATRRTAVEPPMAPLPVPPTSTPVTRVVATPQPQAKRPKPTPGPSRVADLPSPALSTPTEKDIAAVEVPGPWPPIASPPEAGLPPTQIERGDAVTPDTSPVEDGARLPSSSAPLASDPGSNDRSPWAAVGDAGVAIGRGSKTAGVATGGFFSRVARRVAGSF